MDQIICVVGSTATGKTKKAIELASHQPSILVSADSRQVYKGMDIVPGKDHQKDVAMYGIDLVDPDQSCSVSVWYDEVAPHIIEATLQNKQIIVVGGTGLYVKAITDGIKTMSVPLDQNLRDELSLLSVLELQDKLKKLDNSKFESMNHSDQLNPRRLVRAIEIANSGQSLQQMDLCKTAPKIIGLKYKDSNLQKEKIRERVLSRLELGAIAETQVLLTKYNRDLQSMSALGYRSIIKYLDNELSKEEMIESWVHDEMAYVKRQMTWFHKVPVIWYDVDTI
jgi:tRNA dimethylallyltransferase